MEGVTAVLCAAVLIAAQMTLALPSPNTAPAFLWSPRHLGSLKDDVKEIVDYRTISPNELATTVLADGGWSNFVCSGDHQNQEVDIALVFVGRKLQSPDISKARNIDPTLLDLLKVSFTRSNLSMAFPYVVLSDEKDSLENSLISGFTENCGQGVGTDHIAYLGSCSVDHQNIKKVQGMHSVEDFIDSRMEKRGSGLADMIVICSDQSEEADSAQSEGEVLTDIVKFLDQSAAKYTVLYASEPQRTHQFASHLAMNRFLAESTTGNTSIDFTLCDGVCQIKSSLLEGFFVGIVLLIILISGLCCMMGIDTPTRFETPQES